MTYRLIADSDALSRVSPQLQAHTTIALDCEAAGFHRYTDRLCLIQFSTPDETFLLDPLAVDLSEALRPVLEDPAIRVVMHGADFDLRLIHRDLGIRLKGLFDTQAAAMLLGATSLGLASLLEEHLGVKLSKKHQRADWAKRPLPESFLDYAAADTRHLLALAAILEDGLKKAGREDWAQEEFRFLEAIEWTDEEVDPVTRIKGARTLPPRVVTALRTALEWRDEIARSQDRAPFRVVGDSVLVDVVMERPGSVGELAARKGMSPRLAEARGQALLQALDRVDGLPEGKLRPYPRGNRNGFGRPTPEEEARIDKVRALRSARADELGLVKGTLMSNVQITEIVRRGPRTLEGIKEIPGIRSWQADLLGEGILEILAG